MKHLLFFLFLLSPVTASAQNAPVVFHDLPYVKNADERQHLDLYLPANYKKAEKPLPLIIFLHGGYWEFGDKDFAPPFAEVCIRNGFAAAAINYRFVPEHPMPAQIEDCKAAVRWLRASAKKYRLDTERFGAWGYSAGGHLAALLATTAHTREFDTGENLDQPSGISAACDVAGPTDFEAFVEEDPSLIVHCEKVFGGSPEEKMELIRKMGSVNHVSEKSSPILIFHAVDDEVVLVSQAKLLYKTLKKAGVDTEIYLFPEDEGGHGSFRLFDKNAEKIMVKFFKKHLLGEKPAEKPEVPKAKASAKKISLQKPSLSRTVSTVSVSEPAAAKIPRFLIAPPGIDDGRPLKEMLANPESWEKLRAHTDGFHYACQNFARHLKTDDELRECFAAFRKMDMPVHLEVGAVKPWGATGEKTFLAQKPQIDRYLACGADIRGIAMDEPLNCCYNDLNEDMEYAAAETADFIARMREAYPDFIIGDIEGFPSLSADEIIRWIDLLQEKLAEKNLPGLDFFRIDTDWMHFVHDTRKGSWRDMKKIENHCRKIGLPLSVIYWPANHPAMERLGLADDTTWYVGAMQMAYDYAAVGGDPDQILIQSWVNGPKKTIPETESATFTRTALDIAERFLKKKPDAE